jgi:hypothetical protein
VFLAKILAALKIKTLKTTDQRYQATKEMIDGTTLIKSYIWGEVTKQKSQKLESKEIIDLLFHFYQRLYKFTLSAILSLFINRCILIIFR